MTEILTEFSEDKMGPIVERSNCEPYRLLTRNTPAGEIYDGPDMFWSITDVPIALPNAIVRAQLTPGNVDGAIEAAKIRAKARNVPLLWYTSQYTRPDDLGEKLITHGFAHVWDMIGMALDLQTLSENPQTPPGLSIEQM